jgi:hypothetical protein
MMRTILARFAVVIVTPPGYPHSEALREIAETVHLGLTRLGHDSVLTTSQPDPDRLPIVFGAQLLERVPLALRDDAIVYNLEQISPDSPWMKPTLLDALRRHRVWDYSTRNLAALERLGVRGAVHVPIGYVPELARIAPGPDDIDVLFYGSVNDRRAQVLEALAGCGLRVAAPFGCYGRERDMFIGRARIVLNMHFYEARVFEAVRVSYLLANQRFVISERGADPGDEAPYQGGLVFAPYAELVSTCLRYVHRAQERAAIAAQGAAIMRARPIEPILSAALAAST